MVIASARASPTAVDPPKTTAGQAELASPSRTSVSAPASVANAVRVGMGSTARQAPSRR
ncbi:MAG: hypothetical protein M5U28_09435 [Sandaracinaceae bacterium]|nr:hypothetical protein [Sandaracinaceae bacterium]